MSQLTTAIQEAALRVAREYVGKEFAALQQKFSVGSWSVREEPRPSRMAALDFKADRINVTVKDGIVQRVVGIG